MPLFIFNLMLTQLIPNERAFCVFSLAIKYAVKKREKEL